MDIVTYALSKKYTDQVGATKASLVNGKVPADELPSYVDDVEEYSDFAHFPVEGEAGKIYIDISTGYTYRWGGSTYVQIGGANTAYFPIPNGWDITHTTADLCTDIVADSVADAGMVFLGKIQCSDLPGGLAQGEAVIEIISNDNANGKNIHIILTSANQTPYRWEYSYVKINGHYSSPAGWVGFQPELVSGTNIKTINGASVLGSGNLLVTSPQMISKTWAELKALRDAGELLPGQQYRITDYGFTTVTTGTSSAGHVFDIIVTAEDESHLEEQAFAAHHAGDTYFSGNKLEAWRLWYALDNDTNRFDWADATNGKGVIYRMIDEFDNDLPYDFKNCLIGSGNRYTFHNSTGDASLIRTGTNKVYDNVMGSLVVNGKQSLNKNYFWQVDVSTTLVYENTFGNDCYNIVCNGKEFFENKLGNYCNGLTFVGTDNRQNTFGENCHDNTFGQGFYNNVVGNHFSNNTFGSGCYRNTFGTGCYNNNLGNGCTSNTFGGGCYNITLGKNCTNNTFGSLCYHNTLGSTCHYNTFEVDCSYNTFGSNCNRNELSSGCESISTGTRVTYNHFDAGSNNITLGGYVMGCRFGIKCNNITIGSTSADYDAQYITIDSDVSYVKLSSADDVNHSSNNQLQNIHIHSGVRGISGTPVSIVVPERGQSHSYDYYATNSVDVMI